MVDAVTLPSACLVPVTAMDWPTLRPEADALEPDGVLNVVLEE